MRLIGFIILTCLVFLGNDACATTLHELSPVVKPLGERMVELSAIHEMEDDVDSVGFWATLVLTDGGNEILRCPIAKKLDSKGRMVVSTKIHESLVSNAIIELHYQNPKDAGVVGAGSIFRYSTTPQFVIDFDFSLTPVKENLLRQTAPALK